MKALHSLFLVFVLILIALLGAGAGELYFLFGVIVPYLAVLMFVVGFCCRVLNWAKSAVPFAIPTTCGQQESLPWIKQAKLENPSSKPWVIGRMALEILCFRSLFRNTKIDYSSDGPTLRFSSSKWLWMGGLAFHYSFLVIAVRHMRFFTEPVPFGVELLDKLDGILQLGVPALYVTDMLFVGAVTFLFLRRVVIPQVRYVSLVNDFFPLFLILAIGITGMLMRYFIRVDIIGIKELAMGLVTFRPVTPDGIGVIFYIHLFLVCVLLAYFPMSKLMHMGGVFLSPTRNMVACTRKYRHVSPWQYQNVQYHTYAEYEDEFRERMVEAGLPVDKPLENKEEVENV